MATIRRKQALNLLHRYTKSDSLRVHARAVEAAMRYFASEYGEDEEKWGVIGLVHDLDWEQFPNEHCKKTEEILTVEGWPPEYIRAVLSHGWGICTDVEPKERMEKVLYAVDELTGLIIATALVRPSKSLLDTKVSSVRKKWKSESFAAGVDRKIIQKGADMLGIERDVLVEKTLLALQEVASDIGLDGSGAAGG